MKDKKEGVSSARRFLDRMFLTISHYRDYRLVWLGAMTEHMGDWMETVGVLWLVHQIADAPIYLALYPCPHP